MVVALALAAALGYGLSDFLGGLAAKRLHVALVTLLVQAVGGALALVIAVAAGWTSSPDVALWGSVAGAGSAIGTLALYRGLAVGRMAVVAPVSAVTAASIPAVVGIVGGERLTALGWIGIVLALPATVLVSRVPDDHEGPTGLREALVAGVGFAVLYLGLHRAGDQAGTWPLVWEMLVSAVLLLPFAWFAWRGPSRGSFTRSPVLMAVGGGILVLGASQLFVVASSDGLAVASIVTSMYPAFTVLLAYAVLRERISGVQGVGLALSAAAVALIAV